MFDASACSATTGSEIFRVEDFLVATLWHGRMWTLFARATSKQCSETSSTIQAVWCFRDQADAERLARLMAEAVEGERASAWVEPVVNGDGWCAYLHLYAQMLTPVA